MATRKEIKSTLYGAITGITAFSASTYIGAPQYGCSLPNVVIVSVADIYGEDLNAMNSNEARDFSLSIDIYAETGVADDDAIEDHIADVETAIYSSGIESSVIDIHTEQIDFEYSDEGETPIVKASINLAIEYVE